MVNYIFIIKFLKYFLELKYGKFIYSIILEDQRRKELGNYEILMKKIIKVVFCLF